MYRQRCVAAMLLSGDAATAALNEVIDTPPPWLAAEVDPEGRGGRARVLVLAAKGEAKPRVVDLDAVQPATKARFASLSCPLAAYDAKSLVRGLLAAGFALPPRIACLRVTAQILAGGRAVPETFDAMCQGVLGERAPQPQKGLDELQATPGFVSRVLEHQAVRLRGDELVWVSRLEAAALPALADMEHRGIALDRERWRLLLGSAREEREQRRTELSALLDAGGLFGDGAELDSDATLREALARAGHRVKTLRRAELAALPAPLGPTLARFRELSKLIQSYGESFLRNVDTDGRIRATFEQIGASTGRMACHSPNLQSVVKDSPYRGCFRAGEGRALITADYAGCELRIIAELSGDPVFLQVLRDGGDLHARVAQTVFGVPVSKSENPELRHRAKAINFGLAYGMGAGGLARATGLAPQEARQFLQRYFRSFPRIGAFLEETAQTALRRGFAMTMTGRRLYLEPGDSSDARARAERVAKNMPIQGTNADVMKIALARLRTALAPHDAFVVNTVHDEIVVECDASKADELARLVKQEMRAAGAEVLRTIPLDADTVVGASWAK